jgi:sarcosine oxidase
MDADVAVIGVGTMGSMTLWHLARRGISAMGFEQFGIPHDRSAHGAETRIFRTAYMEGAEYVPLLRAALQGWRDLEQETGRTLLRMTGGLSIGNPADEWMQRVMISIREYQLEHEVLDAEEASRRFPQHRLLEDDAVILDKQAGYLRPEFAVASAVARAEQLGAVVHRHTRVEAIEPAGGSVYIRAGGKTRTFRKVVITTGPWASKLLPELRGSVAARRLVATWFAAKEPRLYEPDRFPIVIRHSRGMEGSVSGVPAVDGGSVKLMLDYDFGTYDPDSLDRTLPDEELQTISTVVGERFNGLYPDPIRVGAYMDGYTKDEHAIVGIHPDAPELVVMVGFSGHGFKMAPVFGEIAADLVSKRSTQHGIDHLAPARVFKDGGHAAALLAGC